MDAKLFRIGGISAIVQILGAVVYFIVVGPFLPAPGAPAAEALKNLASAPQSVLWFGWEGVVIDLLMLPVGLALYFALRERQPSYALLALAGLLFGHFLVILNDARLPSISWELAHTYATGNPAQQAAALLVMDSVEQWIGTSTMFAGGLLVGAGFGLFGLAMLTSRWFPRWLGWIGLVGGVLMVLGGLLSPFVPAGAMMVLASFLLNFTWTLISGVYLLRIKAAVPGGLQAA
ncbi:MAG: DUF4386 domain-containing protein [Chloroflexi bacterium]|nr:DUF4386 domain-containing protein [Chloroflexota bacterium]